jgi:DNA mismatch endonuclease (patch repair protein)
VPQGQNYVTDPGLRSELMSKIRSEGTKVEVLVFKEMTSRGVTFQKHYPRALGKPDLAKPRKKLAVFLDGDFWHGRDLARIEGLSPA